MATDPITGLAIPGTGYFLYGPLVMKNWLRSQVTDDFTVCTEIPTPRPARVIEIKSATTSGGSGDGAKLVLSRRRLIIQNYDTSESLAMRVSEILRGYVIAGMWTRNSGYRKVHIVGEPAYLPDPDDPAKTPRAQLTADITVRARFS